MEHASVLKLDIHGVVMLLMTSLPIVLCMNDTGPANDLIILPIYGE